MSTHKTAEDDEAPLVECAEKKSVLIPALVIVFFTHFDKVFAVIGAKGFLCETNNFLTEGVFSQILVVKFHEI